MDVRGCSTMSKGAGRGLALGCGPLTAGATVEDNGPELHQMGHRSEYYRICSSEGEESDGGTVDSRFSFTQRTADQGSGVAAAVIDEVVRQMEQDIPIWEHKKYLAKPMLCDGDGPIPEYRKWASQFY